MQTSVRFLKHHHICPIGESENDVTLLVADPADHFPMRALELATGRKVTLNIGMRSEIDDLIERYYGSGRSAMGTIVENLTDDNNRSEDDIEHLRDLASEAPVIRLVNLVIQRAVEQRASDIHVEPFENRLKVRYRIDGVLHEVESPPAASTAAVISRIKIMAKLNIAERRLPQDGRIMIRVQGKELDLRVSTVPTAHGESVVMRILDREAIVFDFHTLGFTDQFLQKFINVLELPHGILLVTGPTGSGKTTTLYTALSKLNTPDVKIITVEDPVEYQIEGINQIQAKPQIGLDFSHALRSIVRQDPDIIMIGEMRDLETARIAIQSALTGHLVLSTLHTNNAAGGITRMLDMGVEDYLLTSTVNGILAQRLVRRLDRDDVAAPTKRCRKSSSEFDLDHFTDERPIKLYKPGTIDRQPDRLLRPHDDHGIPGHERQHAPHDHAARRHGRARGSRAQGRHAHDVRGRPRQGAARADDDRGSAACDERRTRDGIGIGTRRSVRHALCSYSDPESGRHDLTTTKPSPAGETLDGQMEVGTHDEVIGKLQDAGNIPLEVREADSGDSARSRSPRCSSARRLREAQVVQFTQQLATLLGAGQPLDRALQILLDLPESEKAKRMLERVRDQVRGGTPLVGCARSRARQLFQALRQHGSRRRDRRLARQYAGASRRLSRAQPRSSSRASSTR